MAEKIENYRPSHKEKKRKDENDKESLHGEEMKSKVNSSEGEW